MSRECAKVYNPKLDQVVNKLKREIDNKEKEIKKIQHLVYLRNEIKSSVPVDGDQWYNFTYSDWIILLNLVETEIARYEETGHVN